MHGTGVGQLPAALRSHGHLAEVALGGLLQPWEEYHRADPSYLEFRFLPGVRDALIGGRLRKEIATVRELVRQEVSAHLDQRRSTEDFPAVRHAAAETATTIASDALPFARTTDPGAPAVSGLLLDGIARAFEERDVSIDAVVGSASALLAALAPQVRRVIDGEVRPVSIRVRVMALGEGRYSDAVEELVHLLEGIPERLSIDMAFDARRSASQPPTELYLINGRSALTAYFHLPGEAEQVLHVQPEDRLEETQGWFNSWWELLGDL
ncbi:hypothetical protein [Streptomyces sp. P17]|uniref:hypothetical protein n=1 Tax=Streptomyces sp. P17 TaxID=3074716 RepID=UPI0028F42127|nr:hypothetical protein [Streptomyces sp. P17]MDT9700882.1 hypothetical protein [Streptomyces sp. P17]